MLREEVAAAKEVILATDDDREGEAIAWHICQVCKLPLTTKRILFQEITKSALVKAIQSATILNMPRVHSQQARQILDIYIGFTISPLLWKHIQHTLSAGRCQTPALRMIYEQDQRIKTQDYETDFVVSGLFTAKDIEFKVSHHLLSSVNVLDFFEKCKGHSFSLTKGLSKQVTASAPGILITTSLQQKASSALCMSPQQVMRCAQTLYENGLITYMRTDCAYYSEEFIEKTNEYIKKEYGEKYIGNIKLTEKKAHEGIRITQHNIKTVDIEQNVNRLYEFIYKHTLQSCMSSNITLQTPYVLDYGFTYLSIKTIFQGWKILQKKESETNWETYLDSLVKVNCNKIVAEEKCISQEFHYCEAQLIKKMEKENIGRPSTYVSILESIEKKYVDKGRVKGKTLELTTYELKNDATTISREEKLIQEENKLSITEIGIKVSEFCQTHFEPIFNYRFTEIMEAQLDLIGEGKEHKPIIKGFIEEVNKLLTIDAPKISYRSLHCGTWKKHAVVIKDGPYGFYVEYNKNSISLQKFKTMDIINDWIVEQSINKEDLSELIEYIQKKDGYVITPTISIRNGPKGYYIFHKNAKMKKPKFYNCSEIIEYIEMHDTDKIIDYIEKKYKLI
jgi:DNA topoisomerase-1